MSIFKNFFGERDEDIILEENKQLRKKRKRDKEDYEKLREEYNDIVKKYISLLEEKGKGFSEITELLDDINEYTQNGVFYYRPMTSWLIRWPWATRILSICFWIGILALPTHHLIEVFTGKEEFSVILMLMYAVIIGVYGYGFWKYRKNK